MRLSNKCFKQYSNHGVFQYAGDIEGLLEEYGIDSDSSEEVTDDSLIEYFDPFIGVLGARNIGSAIFKRIDNKAPLIEEIPERYLYHFLLKIYSMETGDSYMEKAIVSFNKLLTELDKGHEVSVINYAEQIFQTHKCFHFPGKDRALLRFTGIYSYKVGKDENITPVLESNPSGLFLGVFSDKQRCSNLIQLDFIDETPYEEIVDYLSNHEPHIYFDSLTQNAQAEIRRRYDARRWYNINEIGFVSDYESLLDTE